MVALPFLICNTFPKDFSKHFIISAPYGILCNMNIIIHYAARIGAYFSIFLFIWALYSELTSTYMNGGCLYKLARMAIMFGALVLLAICRHYGWQ